MIQKNMFMMVVIGVRVMECAQTLDVFLLMNLALSEKPTEQLVKTAFAGMMVS
jgi:hypothetical protein